MAACSLALACGLLGLSWLPQEEADDSGAKPALGTAAPGTAAPETAGRQVQVPEDTAVAALLAALPAGLEAAPITSPWPPWAERGTAGWGAERPWRRWLELLRSEAAAAEPEPERRAQLALLARMQGRDGDAWTHLLACAQRPDLVAGILPSFAPGVPAALLTREGPLPDGVVLAPALPPSEPPRSGLRWLAGRKIECSDFAVGSARCALRVSVSRDGLELSLRHLAGGPARVLLVPPLPRGIDRGLLFADWEKLPEHEGPVEFTLSKDSNEHILWLTFHPPAETWPNPGLESLGSSAGGRELVVLSPTGTEPHLLRFAQSLGELLGVRSSLRASDVVEQAGLERLVLRMGTGPGAERRLSDFIGAAEAFALRR